MYSHFKQMRASGTRKADRDISSDLGIVDHISIFRQGDEAVAAYATGGNEQPGAILPLLYRAEVVTMQGTGSRLFRDLPLGFKSPALS